MKRIIAFVLSLVLLISSCFTLVACVEDDIDVDNGENNENSDGDNNVSNDKPAHEHSFADGKCACGEADPNYKASVDGKTYTFVIEYYLTGADSDAYKAVQALKVGDKIDMEGFLYWYDGAQPHITSLTVIDRH